MHFSRFKAIYFKELKSQFYSLSAYVFIVVFLSISTWIFFQNLFLTRQTSMGSFFEMLPWFFLLLVPALSMRIWSEEKRQGTYESLLVLPISEWQLVLAKFSGNFSFVGITLLFSAPIPFTLAKLGNLDWGPVIGAYLGAWLLAGAHLSLGQFVSSLTKNQIVAFLISIAIAAFFLFLGLPFVLTYVGSVSTILYSLSTFTHFENLAKGIIDFRDIVFYLSFIGAFLYLNVYVLVQRHWK
jgi:ABC-2 type transport system permease protein